MPAGAVELDYPHVKAGHCGSGSYRDLLEFHGLSWGEAPLSEGACFGLGGGLGFAYVEIPEMSTPIYMVGRTAGLETDICTHLGIGLDMRQTDDPDEGWAWLRSELDAGRPTMIWADIGELEYLRVRLRMTMHDIVVCGYDLDAGVALVADNDREEIQRCSLDSLARARNSQSFPAPNRHATWVMRFPDALPAPTATVRRAVELAVANMRGGGDSLVPGAEWPMGLAGVEAFAASYPEWPERFEGKLEGALRGLRAFIVKAGTGGALFRSLHAEFLHDASALLGGDAGLARAASLYDELAGRWAGLGALVASGEAAAHASGLELIEPIVALEREGLEAMEGWLAAG
jgi:hypothetical protein